MKYLESVGLDLNTFLPVALSSSSIFLGQFSFNKKLNKILKHVKELCHLFPLT